MTEPEVRCGDATRTHAEVHERAARAAGGIGDLAGPGDRIVVVLRNDLVYLELVRAAQLGGVVPVTANWYWGPEELGYLLRDSGARAVFAHTDLLPVVEAALPQDVHVVEVEVPAAVAAAYRLGADATKPSGRHPVYEDWLATASPRAGPPADRPTAMLYTSGTTGQPKGVRREPCRRSGSGSSARSCSWVSACGRACARWCRPRSTTRRSRPRRAWACCLASTRPSCRVSTRRACWRQ